LLFLVLVFRHDRSDRAPRGSAEDRMIAEQFPADSTRHAADEASLFVLPEGVGADRRRQERHCRHARDQYRFHGEFLRLSFDHRTGLNRGPAAYAASPREILLTVVSANGTNLQNHANLRKKSPQVRLSQASRWP
jgi:hypothetical protein